MKPYKWDEQKNKQLKEVRGVSFEEILNSKFIGAEKHPKRENQIVLLFEYEDYIWVVPSVIEDEFIFLKTLFPSRKLTKKYLKR
jgi:hypothetical protein